MPLTETRRHGVPEKGRGRGRETWCGPRGHNAWAHSRFPGRARIQPPFHPECGTRQRWGRTGRSGGVGCHTQSPGDGCAGAGAETHTLRFTQSVAPGGFASAACAPGSESSARVGNLSRAMREDRGSNAATSRSPCGRSVGGTGQKKLPERQCPRPGKRECARFGRVEAGSS